ncbi:MAG: dienelactone hydrolase family protein [Pseudomonadota bacterium]
MMAHGRGGSPDDMLNLGANLAIADVAYLAPAAAGHSWWPQSFLAPLDDNEPWLGSALTAFDAAVSNVLAQGISPERVVVAGFSQGACLALEHAARKTRPYRGVVALSGGLVGTGEAGDPPSRDLYGHTQKSFDYTGQFDATEVFLGCHQHDPHIPLARVRETEGVFRSLGAQVTIEIYPGQGHGLVQQEISYLRRLLNA